MKSLLRKIKGYGDEPDLSKEYVVKQWEEYNSYGEFKYCYSIYRVKENKELELVTGGKYIFPRHREYDIINFWKKQKLKNKKPRWYP